jgi:dethiobiotin synthetase
MPSFNDWPERIWVAGTDTNVGKTVVAAALVKHLNASYWKPVQTGSETDDDTTTVQTLTGLDASKFLPNAMRFKAPLSPNQAAELEGVSIAMRDIKLPDHRGRLVMEGAGGLLVPINHHRNMLDLMRYYSAPVVLVARSALGTLNHTFLSLHLLREMRLPIQGVVLVGEPNPMNARDIREIGKVRILAEIPWMDPIDLDRIRFE